MPDIDVIFGIHPVESALQRHPERIDVLLLSEGRRDQRLHSLREQAEANGVRWRWVPKEKLDQLSQKGRHQGALLRCQPLPIRGEGDLMSFLESLERPPFLLVLDGVQDPHNLGACLRTASGVGVDGVVIPRDRSSPLTATVHRVASGAVETLPLFQVTNLARVLRMLKEAGVWLVGLDERGESDVHHTDLRGALALVLGAEGQGLRRLSKEVCDLLIKIPMHSEVTSLNVSVAAGVCLYEARRQRDLKDRP
ncbi:MAG TPA: 23S rRNA (guanosine(2251)-2'-O)-methyltransferase RlmB [Acidiferrobacteraceae bacterium]|nr:23S rRNA (guanosine(2251)-2'-O)-methyltransferase RlmB [Acidiferrobacteraceae bacterium]